MATTTTRLGLRKPASSDSVDVATDIDASYDKIDANVGRFICTSSTRPGSPYQGQLIYETDTKDAYQWNGTSWKKDYTAESLVSATAVDLPVGAGGTGTADAGVSVNSGTTAGTIGAFFRLLKNSVEKWRMYSPQADPYFYIRDVPNSANALSIAPAVGGLPGVALATHHGYRNRLINAVGFPVNQRNLDAAVSSVGAYVCDRWFIGQVASGVTQTLQRSSTSPGSNTDLLDFRYIAWARTVLGTVQPDTLNQRIENVRSLAGKVVTVTVRANTISGSVDLQCGVSQNFGTGGSPSGSVSTFAGNTLTFTTTPSTQSFQITVPSISGKTLGTNGDDNLEVVLIRPLTGSGTTGTLNIFAVQVEDGPIATPFEVRPVVVELAACQRYYWRILGGTLVSFVGSGLAATTTSAYIQVRLPCTMRKLPVLTTSSGAAMNVTTGSGGGVASTAIALNGTVGNLDSVLLTVTVASGLTAKEPSLAWVLTTTSNWIAFDSEL